MVGNDFMPAPKRVRRSPQPLLVAPAPEPMLVYPNSVQDIAQPFTSSDTFYSYAAAALKTARDTLRRFSFVIFAVLFLTAGIAGIKVGNGYWSAHLMANIERSSSMQPVALSISELHVITPLDKLNRRIQSITTQPIVVVIGNQKVAIASGTIKSWLKITADKQNSTASIYINETGIKTSLANIVKDNSALPIDQVSVTHDGQATVIVAGQNGTAIVGNTNELFQQIGHHLLGGRGMQLTLPVKSVPFQAITPTAFSKLIEVNLTTKQLYAYQNGQLIRTFPVSAGKPSTPTPTGEFHIWTKLTSQTMIGPDYVQPNVPYVNYFDHSGDAIHGVYWRPASVFGNVNTSHGCVGLQIPASEWIYNWAPIGTTVITYN